MFRVLKTGPDGVMGEGSSYPKVDDVLRDVYYHRGWDTLEDLHDSIRRWAAVARPGDVFCTRVTVIVKASNRRR